MSNHETQQKQTQLNNQIKQRKLKNLASHAIIIGIGVASVAASAILFPVSEMVLGIAFGAGVTVVGEKIVCAYNQVCKENERNAQRKIDVAVRRNKTSKDDCQEISL